MIRSVRLDNLCSRIHELVRNHEIKERNNPEMLSWDYDPRIVELMAYREALVKQLINERKYQANNPVMVYQKKLMESEE